MARTPVPIDGRTAFVSGAASGIGRAVALRLAAHGCPVAIVDQDGDGLDDLVVPDVDKATRVLGFRAETSLDTMLDEVIPWITKAVADGVL